MSIFFGLLFARRFYCCPALSLSPGRTGGLFPRINAPNKSSAWSKPYGGLTVLRTPVYCRPFSAIILTAYSALFLSDLDSMRHRGVTVNIACEADNFPGSVQES